jgi:hypothetical protein
MEAHSVAEVMFSNAWQVGTLEVHYWRGLTFVLQSRARPPLRKRV